MSARSIEQVDDGDLASLGRPAGADLQRFFVRNPHRKPWRERVPAVAPAQGEPSTACWVQRNLGSRRNRFCYGSPD